MSKIIIMNSAVIPQNQDGIYHYRTLTREDFVIEINWATEIESYVGYQETVDHIFEISGVKLNINRTIVQHVDVPILICRLKFRVNPGLKGQIKPQSDDWDYGRLKKEVK
jgi:hypothetical protein